MVFKPSINLTLVLLVLALAFARMGLWQLERQSEKQQLIQQFTDAPVLDIKSALDRAARFARVEANGRYDSERHILLDNKILDGRAGVQVLTLFTLNDGRGILVNRGWLPMAPDRRSLPSVPTDGSLMTIRGVLNKPGEGGPRVGDPDILVRDRWPQLVTYLELEAVGEALDTSLEPWLLQLDPKDESGFEGRRWKVAEMGPEVHGAYAVQWFGLSFAAVAIWITLGIRRARALAGNSPKEKTELK